MPRWKTKGLLLLLLGMAVLGLWTVVVSYPFLPGMTDAQMLRSLGLDPAKMSSTFTQGADGYSTKYKDADHEVTIVRSSVSGVYVERRRPDPGEWELGILWW